MGFFTRKLQLIQGKMKKIVAEIPNFIPGIINSDGNFKE